ncbi:hypothetical protein ABFS83_04G176200 [Erythranthe nasuta]
MAEIQFHPLTLPILTATSLLLLLWYITKQYYFTKPVGNRKNLSPTLPKLPIIGNLHQLGSLPHRSLHILAGKHGPLMLLHFGGIPVAIASSAEAAREVMKTHDLNFGNRPIFKAYKKLLYDCKNVSVAPYGEYWRKAKGIFVLQLLSNKRVQSYRSIREEETALLIKRIDEEYSSSSGKPVNLSMMFSEISVDGICRSAFGAKCSDSGSGKKFLAAMAELMELLGAISVGDFIPWLSWISCVIGYDKRVDKVGKELDCFLEGVIQEHMGNSDKCKNINGESFVDILLENYSEDSADEVSSIDRNSIKALIQVVKLYHVVLGYLCRVFFTVDEVK